ncbi:MAG: sigma-70 family RNA polymerase sigma factor [Candidatus Omnitrophica bacterium]|nr:sigma-70 family RNA polymerase sigma factor [Candidatus Omnitrophota bacterium]
MEASFLVHKARGRVKASKPFRVLKRTRKGFFFIKPKKEVVRMSYEDVLAKYSPRIRAISYKVRNRYSYCDEDDFFQEALLDLWLRFENGELEGKTDSYILQGSYFFLKNYIRKICKSVDRNSISMYTPIEEDITIEDTLVSDSYTKDTGTLEIYLLLDETESMFTEREKNVFFYRLEGYTTREIGDKIGVSHVMVGKITKNIREKCSALKEELM